MPITISIDFPRNSNFLWLIDAYRKFIGETENPEGEARTIMQMFRLILTLRREDASQWETEENYVSRRKFRRRKTVTVMLSPRGDAHKAWVSILAGARKDYAGEKEHRLIGIAFRMIVMLASGTLYVATGNDRIIRLRDRCNIFE